MLTLKAPSKNEAIPQIAFQSDEQLEHLCSSVREALIESGIVIVQLAFADRSGSTFANLIEAIGIAEQHNAAGKKVWDVKYDRNVDAHKGTRSQTLREFPMHTDASFEDQTPKYVGLYVVQEDRFGGGWSQFVDGRKIVENLSARSRHLLQNTEFTMRVPDEFYKGKTTAQVCLIDADWNFRYRRDLILDSECTPRQLEALDELEQLLADAQFTESIFLRTGSIAIIDNGRFLHARSAVRDEQRHLLRMRFQPKGVWCGSIDQRRSA